MCVRSLWTNLVRLFGSLMPIIAASIEDEDDDDDGIQTTDDDDNRTATVDTVPLTTNACAPLDTLLSNGLGIRSSDRRRPSSLAGLINTRQMGMSGSGRFTDGDKCHVSSRFLPNKTSAVLRYHNKVFCSNYSQDGDVVLTASQDCNLRLYRTNVGGIESEPFKTIKARDVGWSILDTAFSPNGNHFVYSSWSESFHLCNIHGDHEIHEALPLCPDDRRFCIFSLVFSQGGREILGGANDGYLYVYDMETKQRSLMVDTRHSMAAYDNDVNAVAYADSSSYILFSGGDDGLCKVWDRRALNEADPRPVGILAGHHAGITFIDSRGDGRHLITNSKDQSIKLWDIRVFSPPDGIEDARRCVDAKRWDYRWQKWPRQYMMSGTLRLKGDTSLMTYTGHRVLKTLIRCHFSPVHSTGQRYIYTGCADGPVIIYDVLTGEMVKMLDKHGTCTRDVSWHPYRPDIVSASWDGSVMLWSYVVDDDESAGNEDDDSYLDDSQWWDMESSSEEPSYAMRTRYNLRRRTTTTSTRHRH